MVNEITANIFDIQRFCLFDGEGIRTTVFFKGCPLRCKWCCNPESQSFAPQLLIKPWDGCGDCLRCIDKCERGVLSFKNGRVVADEAKCGHCAHCESLCAFDKIKVAGKSYTVDEVMEIILKDKDYYSDSNGGVTLSGGEVTAHGEFVIALTDRLEKENISVMIETCGYADGETFAKIAARAKRVYFDIKLLDNALHEKHTGKGNTLILENLKRATAVTETVVRVPLIPDVNMNTEFYRALGELTEKIPVKAVELLPYHRLGVSKYTELGKEYALSDTVPAPRAENEKALAEIKKYTSKPVGFRQ